MDVFGGGVPALFVHGSFGWGLETFPEQRALADQYQVDLIDRRGFGGSTSLKAEGWPVDMHDVAALLDDLGPAHMVGQSYGAVVVLLAAGLRPERVRSLVAIEPPAFEVARGDADADATTTSLKPVFDRAHTLTAEEFVADWARANGMPEERLATWIEGFGDQEWAAAEASRRERWPGDGANPVRRFGGCSIPEGARARRVETRGGRSRRRRTKLRCFLSRDLRPHRRTPRCLRALKPQPAAPRTPSFQSVAA
jgi:pimeloyl-ACP methyl ester carboxylesterase